MLHNKFAGYKVACEPFDVTGKSKMSLNIVPLPTLGSNFKFLQLNHIWNLSIFDEQCIHC